MSKSRVNWLIDLYNGSLDRYNYINNIYPNMIENNICLMTIIIALYNSNNKEIYKFLEDNNSYSLYNSIFSLKVFNFKIKLDDKIKFLLFRINKKLYKLILNIYLKIKRKV